MLKVKSFTAEIEALRKSITNEIERFFIFNSEIKEIKIKDFIKTDISVTILGDDGGYSETLISFNKDGFKTQEQIEEEGEFDEDGIEIHSEYYMLPLNDIEFILFLINLYIEEIEEKK